MTNDEFIALVNLYQGISESYITASGLKDLKSLYKKGYVTLNDDDHWIPTSKGYEYITKCLEVLNV